MDRSKFTYAGSSIDETIAILRRELKEGDVVLVKGTSSQRLERVILALQGSNVLCPVKTCHVNSAVRCAVCPVLERGSAALANRFVRNMVDPPQTRATLVLGGALGGIISESQRHSEVANEVVEPPTEFGVRR